MKNKLIFIFIFFVFPVLLFSQGVIVKPGTNVTVKAGSTLKITNGGDLLLLDDYTYAPSFLDKGALLITGGGDAKVEQYLEKDQWHIISTPASNENIGAYMWMFLYSWDEPSAIFTDLNYPTSLPLNVGEGYHVWSYTEWTPHPSSPDSVVFNGTLNKSNISITLSNTDASTESGWNLIGNPFPCAIEWNGNANWNLLNVDATIYFFDHGGSGNYATWNFNIPAGTNKHNGYIAATQGFWIRASDTTGTAASLIIPSSERLHSDTTEFYKESKIIENMLRLHVDGNMYSDECVIGFIPDASIGFDSRYDAYNLFTEISSPDIYAMNEGIFRAMAFYPTVEDQEIIPVGFKPGAEGNFTIHVTGTESFDMDIPVYLEDKKDNIFQDLRANQVYVFASNPLDEPYRFDIHFAEPIGIDENTLTGQIHIYAYNKMIYVDIPAEINGDIEVCNLLGEHIITKKAEPGLNSIPVYCNNTYYLIKVISEEGVKSAKVYIK
ncbi:MAG: hypothetical protein K8S16_20375 [Bacteroidales bacterium]|nr:hypothetical protein [Bacteroidales bacterium]